MTFRYREYFGKTVKFIVKQLEYKANITKDSIFDYKN